MKSGVRKIIYIFLTYAKVITTQRFSLISWNRKIDFSIIYIHTYIDTHKQRAHTQTYICTCNLKKKESQQDLRNPEYDIIKCVGPY